MAKLGDIATYINGYAFKPSDWSTEGLPIIRIQDLTGSSYKTNKYNGDYDKKYEVNNGDILISWSASLGVFVWKNDRAVLNQHIFKVIFNKKVVDKDFFVYQVKNILRKAQNSVHGATMKHLTKPVFDSLDFYLPLIEEQKRIAKQLKLINLLIDRRNDQIKKLDLLVKSRFVEMFGDPVINSKGWITKKLTELGTLSRGMSKHRPRNAPELLGGPYPLIQTGDVANADGYIKEYKSTYSELGFRQSKMWPKGTLCITIAANIAKTAILEFPSCFPDSIVGFNAYSDVTNEYIHHWFTFVQRIIEEQAPESAQKNINMKILSDLKVMVPDKNIQHEYVDFLKQVDKSKFVVTAKFQ